MNGGNREVPGEARVERQDGDGFEVPEKVVAGLGTSKKPAVRVTAAKRCFDALSYSRQRGLVDPIEQAKTDETRQRRIEKAIATLRESGT